MRASPASRGQPLLVLAMILGAWLVGRVLLWAPPFPIHPSPSAQSGGDAVGVAASAQGGPPSGRAGEAEWRGPETPAALLPEPFPVLVQPPISRLPARVDWPPINAAVSLDSPASMTPARRAAGHQMLLAAAFAGRELPPEAVRAAVGGGERASYVPALSRMAVADRPLLGTGRASRAAQPPRLTGDAWLLWRGGSSATVAPGISTYGRSQAGAVLRYRLMPGHSFVPAAYARVTSTLDGPRQREAAAGLSLRPIRSLPVEVAGEARVTTTAGARELRPAAFAVARLPPVALPLGLRGEAYVQAGYVGGRFETAFVDGQARIDRRIAPRDDNEELRAGLAAWGGAQKGAARLDVGPTASVAFMLGEAPSRIAIDYRLRVAGGAAPASGPAVTFSAGF